MPVRTGKEAISFVHASNPPADAPIATIRSSSRGGPRAGVFNLVGFPGISCCRFHAAFRKTLTSKLSSLFHALMLGP